VRFLHTSDWHLGRSLPQGRSRRPEFETVLAEVVAICRDERVDCLLIAGDVYDHKFASAEADQLMFETVVQLHRDGTAVVSIPGNHDSPERWRAYSPLLKEISVHTVTELRAPLEGGVVTVASRDGGESAQIACVPFVQERNFGTATLLFEGNERWPQAYAKGMGKLLSAMCAGFRNDSVNILMAHLFVDGAGLGGGEAEVTLGPQCAVRPALIPSKASYVALGHIHKAQTLEHASVPARYAGSLLQLDFGERGQEKSVTLVEASPRRRPDVREIPLRAGRALLQVDGTLDELKRRTGEFGDAWLRVDVYTDSRIPGIADRVREILPNAIQVRPVYPRARDTAPTQAITSLRPREQFEAYYRAEHRAEPSSASLATFDEVHSAVAMEQE